MTPHIGRPRALDDGKRREICAIISAGCGIETAARYVSCSASTIRREAIRNAHFREELREAELRAQLQPLRAMREAASTHWRAAAWLLERTNPRQFARQRPGACRPQELHDVVDAVIRQAAEELPEGETRERVCRQLMAAAYRASRTLAALEHSRLNPKSGPFDDLRDDDSPEIKAMCEKIDRDRKRAIDSLVRKSQNSARCA